MFIKTFVSGYNCMLRVFVTCGWTLDNSVDKAICIIWHKIPENFVQLYSGNRSVAFREVYRARLSRDRAVLMKAALAEIWIQWHISDSFVSLMGTRVQWQCWATSIRDPWPKFRVITLRQSPQAAAVWVYLRNTQLAADQCLQCMCCSRVKTANRERPADD